MVEQENSIASPAFPYSQDSSARLEKDFYNPWFMIDSTMILNEKPLCSSNADVEDNYSNMIQDNFPKEQNESNVKKYANVATKLEEWSQPTQNISEMFPATYDPYFEVNSPLSFWGSCPLDLDNMKIDDVFQVDKDDLVQSPTLAELNANDESLFDSFDCFDDFIPSGKKAINKQLLMQDFNPDFNIAFNSADNPKIISCSASCASMKEQVFPQKNESLKKQPSKAINKQLLVVDLKPDFKIAFDNADKPKNISCSASSASMKEQVFLQKHESLKQQASKSMNKQLLVTDLNTDFKIAFNNADNPKNISCSASSASMKEQVFPQKHESLKKQASKAINKLLVDNLNPDFNIAIKSASNQKNMSCSLSSAAKKEQVFPRKNDSLKKILIRRSPKEILIKPKPLTTYNLHDKLHGILPASTDDPKKMKKNPKSQLDADCDIKGTLTKASVEQVCVAPCTSNKDPEIAPDTEDDSEMDGDFSSDADEDSEDEIRSFPMKHTFVNRGNLEKKVPKYFWQYNIQSKGPKGPTMKLSEKCSSAHDLKGVSDPIFSSDCPIDGVKHSGKARRGDGNDLTPNPKKLYSIGKELEKLNSMIDGLVPVNELPMNARTKSRKEKNKLASRACRLKKKAQHEANKLKLFGLQEEQKHLLLLAKEAKKLVKARILHFKQNKSLSTLAAIESLQKKKAVTKVAGCSSEFVNNVLQSVAAGDESGGLNATPEIGN